MMKFSEDYYQHIKLVVENFGKFLASVTSIDEKKLYEKYQLKTLTPNIFVDEKHITLAELQKMVGKKNLSIKLQLSTNLTEEVKNLFDAIGENYKLIIASINICDEHDSSKSSLIIKDDNSIINVAQYINKYIMPKKAIQTQEYSDVKSWVEKVKFNDKNIVHER